MRLRALLLLLALSANATGEAKNSGPGGGQNVVIELFSSEGCSSCPPADEVLRTIDSEGRVNGVPVIALELHVDYWNDLGWADPFSRPEWSARQRMYGKSYTPQAVVDGSEELIGSRDAALGEAIGRAATKPHLAVTLVREKDALVVRVPEDKSAERADVLFAVADRNLVTAVPRGENAGRTLKHGPIVRELRNLGVFSGSPFEGRTLFSGDGRRYVAFVQGQKTHRILGSAAL